MYTHIPLRDQPAKTQNFPPNPAPDGFFKIALPNPPNSSIADHKKSLCVFIMCALQKILDFLADLSKNRIMGNLSTIQKYDLLVHIIEESDLSNEEQLKGIINLFPKFIPGKSLNDKYVTDMIIEEYSYARSLGLSIQDSAHTASVSSSLMHKVLDGEGLSLNRFLALVKAELYAEALSKKKHLTNLSDVSDEKNYKASIAFLEKIYPKQYGAKLQIEDVTEDKPSASPMELARKIAFILNQADKQPEKITE